MVTASRILRLIFLLSERAASQPADGYSTAEAAVAAGAVPACKAAQLGVAPSMIPVSVPVCRSFHRDQEGYVHAALPFLNAAE